MSEPEQTAPVPPSAPPVAPEGAPPAAGPNYPPGYETYPAWTCVFQESTDPGAAKLETWTVGNKYLLSCSGPLVPELDKEKIKFFFADPSQEYALHPLQTVVLNPQQAQLVVTGYKPGDYKLENLLVTDGTHGFRIEKLEWKIGSVLEGDPQQQQQQQPIPPFGPFTLGFPWWYYGAWALLALLVVFVLGRKIRRYFMRKKLIESLAAHATALSPYNQLNKDIRILVRATPFDQRETLPDFVAKMEELFRLFLVRRLTIPALQWSDREIIGDLRKRHREVFDDTAVDMRKLFSEYRKAKGAPDKLSRLDAEQLLEMSRRVAEKIEQGYQEASR